MRTYASGSKGPSQRDGQWIYFNFKVLMYFKIDIWILDKRQIFLSNFWMMCMPSGHSPFASKVT